MCPLLGATQVSYGRGRARSGEPPPGRRGDERLMPRRSFASASSAARPPHKECAACGSLGSPKTPRNAASWPTGLHSPPAGVVTAGTAVVDHAVQFSSNDRFLSPPVTGASGRLTAHRESEETPPSGAHQ